MMMNRTIKAAAATMSLLLTAAPCLAQSVPNKDRSSAFGTLGSNKEPIKIDADRLDVFDRESRAIFAGNVVAVQGDSTMKCTTLTVYYEQNRNTAGAGPAAPAGGGQGESIKRIECKGPVTIVSKTQVATGDNATFDRVANRVLLTGNVALSDGPNVTRGERIVYDLNTGVANVETAPGGRVRALFVPGSSPEGVPAADAQKPKRPAATN